MKDPLTIRLATPEDAELILSFIKELAEYEESVDLVKASAADLKESVFQKRQAEVIIAEVNEYPAAFALFFSNYSTFLGKANLYLEDLYVRQEYRGKGIGTAIFCYLAEIAKNRGCDRLDWLCLDKNQSAINFYQKLGAVCIDDRRVFRLEGETLRALPRRN